MLGPHALLSPTQRHVYPIAGILSKCSSPRLPQGNPKPEPPFGGNGPPAFQLFPAREQEPLVHRTTIRNPSWKLAVFMEGEAHHPGTDFGVHFNHLLSQMVAANPSDAATPNAKVSRERSRPERVVGRGQHFPNCYLNTAS